METRPCGSRKAEKDVYQLKLHLQKIFPGDQAAQVSLGMGVAQLRPTLSPTGKVGWEAKAIREGILDLEKLKPDHLFALSTANPGEYLTISAPERIYSLPKDALIQEIDFIQGISSSELMLATEIGQVALVDLTTGVILTPSFGKAFPFLTSISAHQIGGEFEVWAISAAGNRLYRWNSRQLDADSFLEMPRLPEGVNPVSLTSVAEPMHYGLIPKEGAIRDGYFTNYVSIGESVFAQRILVLGSDRKLYGWMPGPEDPPGSRGTRWVGNASREGSNLVIESK